MNKYSINKYCKVRSSNKYSGFYLVYVQSPFYVQNRRKMYVNRSAANSIYELLDTQFTEEDYVKTLLDYNQEDALHMLRTLIELKVFLANER